MSDMAMSGMDLEKEFMAVRAMVRDSDIALVHLTVRNGFGGRTKIALPLDLVLKAYGVVPGVVRT